MMDDSVKETNKCLSTWERICPICKKRFFPTPQHAYKFGKKVFCTYSCFLKKDDVVKPECKKVAQYTVDGKFVKLFDSALKASVETNIGINSIRCCCRGESRSAGKYVWKYVKEERR